MTIQFQFFDPPNRDSQAVDLFLKACRHGDLATVQENLEQANDAWLAHGLKEAAEGDQPEMMDFLLEKGAIIQIWPVQAAKSKPAWEVLLKHGLDVNNPMPWGHVPLMSVVSKNNPELLMWYLSQGADPNLGLPRISIKEKGSIDASDLPSPNSSAALEAASRDCDTGIIDILLEHGARFEDSLVFHYALMREQGDRTPMMEYLLNLGADINQFGWLSSLPHGGTALHLAAFFGRLDDVRWLLEHGADPTIKARGKYMPESYAIIRNHFAVLKLIHDWRGIVPVD